MNYHSFVVIFIFLAAYIPASLSAPISQSGNPTNQFWTRERLEDLSKISYQAKEYFASNPELTVALLGGVKYLRDPKSGTIFALATKSLGPESHLGKGFSGTVKEAVNIDNFDQIVLVKRPNTNNPEFDTARELFDLRSEAEKLPLIDLQVDGVSPIIPYISADRNSSQDVKSTGDGRVKRGLYGENGYKHYMLMKKLDGIAMKDFMDITNDFGALVRAYIGAEKSLNALHERGYIHTDNHLGNFLVEKDAKRVHLIDAGRIRKMVPNTIYDPIYDKLNFRLNVIVSLVSKKSPITPYAIDEFMKLFNMRNPKFDNEGDKLTNNFGMFLQKGSIPHFIEDLRRFYGSQAMALELVGNFLANHQERFGTSLLQKFYDFAAKNTKSVGVKIVPLRNPNNNNNNGLSDYLVNFTVRNEALFLQVVNEAAVKGDGDKGKNPEIEKTIPFNFRGGFFELERGGQIVVVPLMKMFNIGERVKWGGEQRYISGLKSLDEAASLVSQSQDDFVYCSFKQNGSYGCISAAYVTEKDRMDAPFNFKDLRKLLVSSKSQVATLITDEFDDIYSFLSVIYGRRSSDPVSKLKQSDSKEVKFSSSSDSYKYPETIRYLLIKALWQKAKEICKGNSEMESETLNELSNRFIHFLKDGPGYSVSVELLDDWNNPHVSYSGFDEPVIVVTAIREMSEPYRYLGMEDCQRFCSEFGLLCSDYEKIPVKIWISRLLEMQETGKVMGRHAEGVIVYAPMSTSGKVDPFIATNESGLSVINPRSCLNFKWKLMTVRENFPMIELRQHYGVRRFIRECFRSLLAGNQIIRSKQGGSLMDSLIPEIILFWFSNLIGGHRLVPVCMASRLSNLELLDEFFDYIAARIPCNNISEFAEARRSVAKQKHLLFPIGAQGSGKSTLCNLIAKVIESITTSSSGGVKTRSIISDAIPPYSAYLPQPFEAFIMDAIADPGTNLVIADKMNLNRRARGYLFSLLQYFPEVHVHVLDLSYHYKPATDIIALNAYRTKSMTNDRFANGNRSKKPKGTFRAVTGDDTNSSNLVEFLISQVANRGNYNSTLTPERVPNYQSIINGVVANCESFSSSEFGSVASAIALCPMDDIGEKFRLFVLSLTLGYREGNGSSSSPPAWLSILEERISSANISDWGVFQEALRLCLERKDYLVKPEKLEFFTYVNVSIRDHQKVKDIVNHVFGATDANTTFIPKNLLERLSRSFSDISDFHITLSHYKNHDSMRLHDFNCRLVSALGANMFSLEAYGTAIYLDSIGCAMRVKLVEGKSFVPIDGVLEKILDGFNAQFETKGDNVKMLDLARFYNDLLGERMHITLAMFESEMSGSYFHDRLSLDSLCHNPCNSLHHLQLDDLIKYQLLAKTPGSIGSLLPTCQETLKPLIIPIATSNDSKLCISGFISGFQAIFKFGLN